MKREDFERSFGETPQLFTSRIDRTLQTLKEEPPVRKFTARTVALAILIALTVCGIAYAIVTFQGQEWYFSNISTAYQEQQPEKHQAILDNLQTDIPQTDTRDAAGLIDMTVQDYAWVSAQQVFTLSMAARVTDGETYELHPMQNLDTDGAYGDDPNDSDSHAEHYLWTEKGFGLPADTMADPAKTLLLVEPRAFDSVTIGETACAMPESTMGTFVGEDGASVFVMEYDLARLEEETLRAQYQPTPAKESKEDYATLRPLTVDAATGAYPLPDESTREAVSRMQNRLCELGYPVQTFDGVYDSATQEAVAAFQQANGLAPDGIAGSRTQAALYADAAIGADGTNAAAQELSSADEAVAYDAAYQAELAKAAVTRKAIAENTDADGMLTLCMHYLVTPLTDGELGESSEGAVSFQVRID